MKSKSIYDGAYIVYEDGRVWSNKTGKFLKHAYLGRNRNYAFVLLCVKRGEQKSHTIHRLVAECFIPNPDNKPEVNHIDGNPRNNDMSNLEWCTRSENCQHAYDIGLMNANLKTKKCKCGELISQRSEMCAKCRTEIKKQRTLEAHIDARNAEADKLQRFCKTTRDKRFIALWRTGMTYKEIGNILGVTRQAIDEKHKTLLGRLNKYNECLAIVNGDAS